MWAMSPPSLCPKSISPPSFSFLMIRSLVPWYLLCFGNSPASMVDWHQPWHPEEEDQKESLGSSRSWVLILPFMYSHLASLAHVTLAYVVTFTLLGSKAMNLCSRQASPGLAYSPLLELDGSTWSKNRWKISKQQQKEPILRREKNTSFWALFWVRIIATGNDNWVDINVQIAVQIILAGNDMQLSFLKKKNI